MPCRAAACSAGRARSTGWCTCAGRAATTTPGPTPAARAGTGRACSRRSRTWRPSSSPPSCADHNPLSDVFIAAAAEVGYASTRPSTPGRSTVSAGIAHRSRTGAGSSSYRAFVAPVADRPNLTVIPGTTVERLLIDAAGHVSGVETRAEGGGALERIACGEVVLSAGAFESPRILMLVRHRAGGSPPARWASRRSSTCPSATTSSTTC